jgi:uncharacterized membrane protein
MASTKARSLTKALTWRATSTIATTMFVWLVSGKLSVAMTVLAFDVTFMTGLYYAHERLWKSIAWGKFPTDWTKYGWRRDEPDESVQVQGGEEPPEEVWPDGGDDREGRIRGDSF